MKYKILLILFGTLLLNNLIFSQGTKYSPVKVGHIFNISFPNYMTRTYGLNNAASVQYMNIEKEAYTIVLDDEKEEITLAGIQINNLNSYYDFFISNFDMDSAVVLSKSEIQINKNNSIQCELSSEVEGAKIYYYITLIETKEYYYSIISWTLFEQKDKLIVDYKKIAESLKEF